MQYLNATNDKKYSTILIIDSSEKGINNFGYNSTDNMYYILDYNTLTYWKIVNTINILFIYKRSYIYFESLTYSFLNGVLYSLSLLGDVGGTSGYYINSEFIDYDEFISNNEIDKKIHSYFLILKANERDAVIKKLDIDSFIFNIPNSGLSDCNANVISIGYSSSQLCSMICDYFSMHYIVSISLLYNEEDKNSVFTANKVIYSLTPIFKLENIIKFNITNPDSIINMKNLFINKNDPYGIIVLFGLYDIIEEELIKRIFLQLDCDNNFVLTDIYISSLKKSSYKYIKNTYRISTFFEEYESNQNVELTKSIKEFSLAIKKSQGMTLYIEEPSYLGYLSVFSWRDIIIRSGVGNITSFYSSIKNIKFSGPTGVIEMGSENQLLHHLFVGKFNGDRYDVIYYCSSNYRSFIMNVYSPSLKICNINNNKISYSNIEAYDFLIILNYGVNESRKKYYDYFLSFLIGIRHVSVDATDAILRPSVVIYKDISEIEPRIKEFIHINFDTLIATVIISGLNDFIEIQNKMDFPLVFYLGQYSSKERIKENVIQISLLENHYYYLTEEFLKLNNIVNTIALIPDFSNLYNTTSEVYDVYRMIIKDKNLTDYGIYSSLNCDNLINELKNNFLPRITSDKQFGVLNFYQIYCYKEIVDFFSLSPIPSSYVRILHYEVPYSTVLTDYINSVNNYYIYHILPSSVKSAFHSIYSLELNDYSAFSYALANIARSSINKVIKYTGNSAVNSRLFRYGLYNEILYNELGYYTIDTSNTLITTVSIAEYTTHLDFSLISSGIVKSDNLFNYGKTLKRVNYTLSILITTCLFISVGIVLNTIFLFITYINRKSIVIIQTNISFSYGINIVFLLFQFVAILYLIPSDVVSFMCVLDNICFITVINLAIIVFFSKTWKIHVVLNNKTYMRVYYIIYLSQHQNI